MFSSRKYPIALVLLLSACASKPAPTPTVASSQAIAEAPPLDATEPSLADESPKQLLALSSPVAGPARDELPEILPQPIERPTLDLATLETPPLLELDAHGHRSKVRSLLFSHDGRYLVSAGYDKAVRVWSSTTGELTRTIRGEIGPGPAGRIYAMALSDKDALLAVGGWLGRYADRSYTSARNEAYKIRIYDFYSGSTLRLLEGHYDVVLSLAFSHFGRQLISGGGDRQARIWDANTGRLERTLSGHGEGVSAVAFSADDRLVATGSLDKTARLWEVATGRLVATLTGHGAAVEAVGFTPDGRYLITGSLDRTLRLWNAQNGEFIKILAQLDSGIPSFSITSDGGRIVVGSADGNFENRVIGIPDGRVLSKFAGHDNIVLGTVTSPNGRWAATAGGSDFAIAVWDVATGQQQLHVAGHGSPVWSVAFSSDGGSIAWGTRFEQSGYGGTYQLNGPLRHSFSLGRNTPTLGPGPDLGSDAGYLRAQTRVGSVELGTPNGREHSTLQVMEGGRVTRTIVRDVTSGFDHRSYTLTADGRIAVSGGANGTLTSYDVQSGAKLRDFVGHTGDVLAVAPAPDGRLLVSGSADQTVRLWEISSGSLLLTLFRARNGQWVAYTPSGYYASSAYGDAYIGWHVNRGPDSSASFFPASSFVFDLRNDRVVRSFLETAGDVERAVAMANQGLADWQAKIPLYRFEDLPQFAPPAIYRLEPGVDTTVKNDRLVVRAKAYAPTSEPITELYFLVNGRRVDERWWQHVGRPAISYQGRYAEITATLPLPQTINRVSVIARNRFNASAPESIEVRRKGGPAELESLYRPDLYVLSIGISHYVDPSLQSLRYAHADASAVADLMKQQAGRLYGRVHARQLVEKNATLSSLREHLRWLANSATQKDVALIFLAGHAIVDERGNYYFMPQEGSLKAPSNTALRWTEFQAVLDSLPSKVILLADTCHGGAITGKAERARGASNTVDFTNALRATFASGTGVVVMTASTGVEDSFESDRWRHGAFTKALLDGLSGQADYDRDRAIYIRELDHYLTKRVQQLTEGRQHPTTEVPRSMPNFPFISFRTTK